MSVVDLENVADIRGLEPYTQYAQNPQIDNFCRVLKSHLHKLLGEGLENIAQSSWAFGGDNEFLQFYCEGVYGLNRGFGESLIKTAYDSGAKYDFGEIYDNAEFRGLLDLSLYKILVKYCLSYAQEVFTIDWLCGFVMEFCKLDSTGFRLSFDAVRGATITLKQTERSLMLSRIFNNRDLWDNLPLFVTFNLVDTLPQGVKFPEGCVLNLNPYQIKLGIPTAPLYYGNDLQTTFGVTGGFDTTNQGYDPNQGYWYLGRDLGNTYIDISSLNLNPAQGITIEVECEFDTLQSRDGNVLFGISSKADLSKDRNNSQYMDNYSLFCASWYGSGTQLRVRGSGGTQTNSSNYGGLLTEGNLGTDNNLSQRTSFVLTWSGGEVKAYRGYNLTTTSAYNLSGANPLMKWLFLNRGSYNNRFFAYANMKIFKLRLWNRALSPSEVSNLRNF